MKNLHILPKEEPKLIKCYCGHTTTCDCEPKEEPKQELGYICPQTKLQCDDECCVNAEDCNIEALTDIVSDLKQETLEEAMNQNGYYESDYDKIWREGVEFGVKWQAERMYSQEDLRQAFLSGCQSERQLKPRIKCWEKWFEQFKKK